MDKQSLGQPGTNITREIENGNVVPLSPLAIHPVPIPGLGGNSPAMGSSPPGGCNVKELVEGNGPPDNVGQRVT